jgi:phosphatidate cytidylyltransferase
MAPDHKNIKNNPKKKSDLLTRVLSALVMLPVAIYIILKGEYSYLGLVIVLSALILFEWNNICEGKSLTLTFAMQLIVVLYAVISLYFNGMVNLKFLAIGISATIIVAFLRKASFKWAFKGLLYALIPAVSLIWLRNYSLESGGYIVLWAMIIVWSMDTGGYFAGKNIGGPKMAPKISPNKTWSGLAGGTILAMITGSTCAYYFDFGVQIWIIALVSGGLAIWSQIGDLYESSLKRRFDVKDSGALIPGHGGIMDRVDGVVFVIPLVAVMIMFSSF